MAAALTHQDTDMLLSLTDDEGMSLFVDEDGLAEMQREAPTPRKALWVARRLGLTMATFVVLGVVGFALSTVPKEARTVSPKVRSAEGFTSLTGSTCENYPRIEVDQVLTNKLEDPSVGIVFHGIYNNPLTDENDVEIEIRMKSDSYSATHQGHNGLSNHFITIWMNGNSKTDISADIVSKETGEPLKVTEISWTFFDIDSEDGFDGLCEEVDVQPVNEVIHYDKVQVIGGGDVATTGLLKVRNTGGQEANPTRADELTAAQASRAAQAKFFHASGMTITLRTGDCGSRKFMMVAMPIVECATTPEGAPLPEFETTIGAPSTKEIKYCLFCWIHKSLSFIPPCTSEPAWWAKGCM